MFKKEKKEKEKEKKEQEKEKKENRSEQFRTIMKNTAGNAKKIKSNVSDYVKTTKKYRDYDDIRYCFPNQKSYHKFMKRFDESGVILNSITISYYDRKKIVFSIDAVLTKDKKISTELSKDEYVYYIKEDCVKYNPNPERW